MSQIESYTELITRHAAELDQRNEKDRQLLALTVNVFINGNAIDKHPDCAALNHSQDTRPTLLWRGDVVAESPEDGIIMVNRYSYPVTPELESQLRQKGWIKSGRANRHEYAWVSRPRLGKIVRHYLKEDLTD